MIIRFILVLISFLSLFSCKNERRGTLEVAGEIIPVIDIEKAMGSLSNKKMNFSEFVEDVTYVPLETTDESIASGNKSRLLPIIVSENYIFYGESMYSLDGRFIRKLGKEGQGPGEYVLAVDIAADEGRQEFYVYDNRIRDVYVYDFENCFKRKVPMAGVGGGISLLSNGKIVLFRDNSLLNDHYEYMVFDTENGEVLFSRSSGISKDSNLTNLWNMVWRNNREISYYEASTDTIFNLNEQGGIDMPRYIVNFGKHKYKYPGDENMVRLTRIEESSQYLFFALRGNSTSYYGAYNKQTGETAINKPDKFFNNDIDGGIFSLFLSSYDGNRGFHVLMPNIVKEKIGIFSSQNSGYDKMKNQKLRELIDKVDEEDDPIFCFFKLK